jgi:hypothetical protein
LKIICVTLKLTAPAFKPAHLRFFLQMSDKECVLHDSTQPLAHAASQGSIRNVESVALSVLRILE